MSSPTASPAPAAQSTPVADASSTATPAADASNVNGNGNASTESASTTNNANGDSSAAIQASGAQSPAPSNSTNATGAAPSTSLYVGELDNTVTEAMLYEIFSMIGTVISIRVCRDAVTRRSLGYAYVNYLNGQDAERALDQLNYSLIKGKPCRIMWSQRDPSLRKGGAGNIFIKNLDETIDNKALHDTFVAFGPIVSCKVALDEHGKSRGYGFVHYETTESAEKAIAEVNGMMLADKIVFVGHYVPKKERQAKMDEVKAKFTNLYVKNLPLDTTDEDFRKMFEKFGTVTSAVIQPNTVTVEGKELKFGFVNFESHEAARKAVEELHEFKLGDETLYVSRAQKKGEREEELRKSYEAQKYEKTLKYQGVNLYVKNLDDEIDEEKLQAEFAQYGTITSCKIMKDEKGNSRGFGFVCFSAPDEATKAVTEMNGKMIGQKPLYVSLAQRKDVRQKHLEGLATQRTQIQTASGIPPAGYPGMPGVPPMYYGQPGAFPQGRGGPNMMGFPQGGPGMMMPRPRFAPPGQMPMGVMGPYGPMGYPGGYPQGMPPNGRGAPNMNGGRNGPMGGMPAQGRMPNGAGPQGGPQMGGAGRAGPPPNAPAGPGARAGIPAGAGPRPNAFRGPQQQRADAPQQQAPAQPSLTAAALANASPAEQKQILGETIYPKIHATQPELAGKITGMLLEMDNAELLVLLEDDVALDQKVQEAIGVLEAYNKKPEQEGEEAAPEAAAEETA